jgi:phenylalanyl-tRNA synthetase beta chain
MTFAFIEREAAVPFCPPGTAPHAIANPLSEKYAVLRPSLLPGLVDACAHNRRRAIRDVRLFETGSRFTPGAPEDRAAAVIWCGAARPGALVEIRTPGGLLRHEGRRRGCRRRVRSPDRDRRRGTGLARAGPYGRGARPAARGPATLGTFGQLSPEIAEQRGFPAAEDIFLAELDLAVLFSGTTGDDLRAEPLPRYPTVVRDVSLLVPDVLPAATVRGTIRSSGPPTLVSIVEFDRYSGAGVPPGRISLSLRLTFRASDRTLTDEEVQAAMDRILSALGETHGAEQR